MLKWFLIVTLSHCSTNQQFCDPMPGSGISIIQEHVQIEMPSREICEQVKNFQTLVNAECWAEPAANKK